MKRIIISLLCIFTALCLSAQVRQFASVSGKVKDENGEPVEPVFMTHCISLNMEDEMISNLLEAYGIPCLKQYPNDGDFGRLILGMSGPGVDIYVPKTMYEDAVNLSEGSAEYEEL